MIKSTVKLTGIRPEMAIADTIIRLIFMQHGFGCIITSALDSHEGRISFHNEGFGLDYRTKHIASKHILDQIILECKTALPQYDISLHSANTDNEHMHVEFDPKSDFKFQAIKKKWLAGEEVTW